MGIKSDKTIADTYANSIKVSTTNFSDGDGYVSDISGNTNLDGVKDGAKYNSKALQLGKKTGKSLNQFGSKISEVAQHFEEMDRQGAQNFSSIGGK
jgi:type VII secretion effector (TIGR04197 family)